VPPAGFVLPFKILENPATMFHCKIRWNTPGIVLLSLENLAKHKWYER
jgi:hypothetical protein